jgi:hypothetical protein
MFWGGAGEALVFAGFDCGLFLFEGHVAIFSGIKDFPAVLAFNKFYVVLSGDNFDDGMFALGGHRVGECIGRILPVSVVLVNGCFPESAGFIYGEFLAVMWRIAGERRLRKLYWGRTLI